jgi:flagellar basal-body rod modification protein FlgD
MNIASTHSNNNVLSSALQNATTPTNGTGQATGSTSGSASSSGASNISNLANEGTFLNLLVAQLENQDPMNPTDGTQFVTQLAQFTQVDQMIGISQNVATIAQDMGNASGVGSSTTAPVTPPATSKTP